MKFSKTLFALSCSLLLALPLAAKEKKPANQKEKVSYSIGVRIGSDFKRQGIEVDSKQLLQGIEDGLTDAKTALTPEEMGAALNQLRTEIQNKMQKERAEQSTKATKEGSAFLEKNKKEKGVVTTQSGLQYKIITTGKGAKPKATDQVVTHYKGTLLDGTVFDSSYTRGTPATFPVNGVIPGWSEALQLMPAGSKWMLWIPANLAYGERGAGPMIGPNQTLTFEVELLEIKK